MPHVLNHQEIDPSVLEGFLLAIMFVSIFIGGIWAIVRYVKPKDWYNKKK